MVIGSKQSDVTAQSTDLQKASDALTSSSSSSSPSVQFGVVSHVLSTPAPTTGPNKKKKKTPIVM